MLGSRQLPLANGFFIYLAAWTPGSYTASQCSLHAHTVALLLGPPQFPMRRAGVMGRTKTIACASSAICMLFKLRGTLCWSALLCRLCGAVTLPRSALTRTHITAVHVAA